MKKKLIRRYPRIVTKKTRIVICHEGSRVVRAQQGSTGDIIVVRPQQRVGRQYVTSAQNRLRHRDVKNIIRRRKFSYDSIRKDRDVRASLEGLGSLRPKPPKR